MKIGPAHELSARDDVQIGDGKGKYLIPGLWEMHVDLFNNPRPRTHGEGVVGLRLFGAFGFMFHQAESRTMPAEVWEWWSVAARWWLSFPGARAWWTARPTPFSARFSAFVEAALNQALPAADADSHWQEFLRAPNAPIGRAYSHGACDGWSASLRQR